MTSLIVFSTFIYGTLLFGEFRLAFAFGGIALLLALALLDVQGFTESANLKVIIFLVGMFLVIGFLEENQFFEHIVEHIVARVGPRPKVMLLAIMIMATVAAALVDEVTSILFMTGTMLHLTSKYKLRPAPFIIMLVFATNIGSAASSIGNPIGVMIALNAGFSFTEFLRWSAPIALAVNVATYFVCKWWFADSFNAFADAVRAEHEAKMAKRRAKAARAGLVTQPAGGAGVPGLGPELAMAVSHGMAGAPDFSPIDRPTIESAAAGGSSFDSADDEDDDDHLHEGDDPESRRARNICWIVFLTTITLLMTHSATEHTLGRLMGVAREVVVSRQTADGKDVLVHLRATPNLVRVDGTPVGEVDPSLVGTRLKDGGMILSVEMGLGEGSMMIGAALLMGSVVLLLRRERARELVERRVDWWTLTFFMMLFASVGTLEHTGVTGVIAQKLIGATGDRPFLLINIVGWATGWLSAFLDNVLAVATFMPVIHDVRLTWAAQNPNNPGYPEAIYWLMLFGGTFMGNMTVIGSTANIIAVGVLEKRGHGTVKFGEWFKIGFIVSIVSMVIATVLLGVQTGWFTTPLLRPPSGILH
jgi:Na+/H+ antiporter NhaD/arsenite permease-like protein